MTTGGHVFIFKPAIRNPRRAEWGLMDRERLLREAAALGKYAPLYRHLSASCGAEWCASFCEVETILGFLLPDSARLQSSWWSNRKKGGGHSHALPRSGDAGVRTHGARADRRVVQEAQIRR